MSGSNGCGVELEKRPRVRGAHDKGPSARHQEVAERDALNGVVNRLAVCYPACGPRKIKHDVQECSPQRLFWAKVHVSRAQGQPDRVVVLSVHSSLLVSLGADDRRLGSVKGVLDLRQSPDRSLRDPSLLAATMEVILPFPARRTSSKLRLQHTGPRSQISSFVY